MSKTLSIIDSKILFGYSGRDYHYYGLDVIRELQDENFQGTVRFPYVALCDFWIRRTGANVQRYTVNLFNEKVNTFKR